MNHPRNRLLNTVNLIRFCSSVDSFNRSIIFELNARNSASYSWISNECHSRFNNSHISSLSTILLNGSSNNSLIYTPTPSPNQLKLNECTYSLLNRIQMLRNNNPLKSMFTTGINITNNNNALSA